MAVPYHTHSFEIPSATKAEVEAGVRTDVAATPASLGSAASKDVSYFATAGQGGNADTAVQSVNGKTGKVIALAKGDIGLGNIDDTSDADKPISMAAQAALNLKANTSDLGTAAGRNAEEFATADQGALASTAAQQATIFTAGSGLTGGGTLAANRTFALSSTSLSSLALADTAVQTINGKSGRTITLSSGDVGAVPIARETEIIANTAARHSHNNKAVLDATTAAFTVAMSSKLAGIPADADKTPGVATTTSDGLMSSGDKIKLNGIAVGATANTGTVTSVALTVPAGLAVAGTPITAAGTFAISYAAGYRGYTTAEANKLAGIPADADKTPALAAVATSGNYADLNGKPTLGSLAAKNNIAIADISATGTPSAATFLRGDGTWGTVAGAGTVTSVGLSAPTGFSVSGTPVTGSGTLTISYASGYQGYTTVEANKLAGIPADADKTPTLATVATTGSYVDLSNKPTIPAAQVQTDWNAASGISSIANKPATFPPSLHTHTPSEVGLGNVANKTEAQMVASGAVADALGDKVSKSGDTMSGALVANGVETSNGSMTVKNDGYSHVWLRDANNNEKAVIFCNNAGEAATFRVNGTQHFNFQANGSFVAPANIAAYSDVRLKAEIQTISNALELIKNLRGTSYIKGGRKQFGFIAQEVREIVPEAVFESTDENDPFLKAGHETGTLSVAADNTLLAIVVEAMKELAAEVEDMRGKLK